MKTALPAILLLVLFSSFRKPASAQYTALSQNFNGFNSLSISDGWTHSWSGIIPWRAEEPYLVSCLGLPGTDGVNKVAYIVDCGFSNADNSSVLMKTPMLDFTAHSGMYLRFGSNFKEQNFPVLPEEATVEISTNGGATWTVLRNIHRNGWLGKYENQYVDLGAYSFTDSVKIGFRYNDHGLYGGGWSIDNVKIYKPAQHDVMLVTATPDSVLASYCTVGDSVAIGGTVYNAGIQPVTEFDVHYQLADGSGPVYNVHYANVNLASFDTMTFQHPKQFVTPARQQYDLKVWLTMPQDTIYTNDTLPVSIRGAAFMPKKLVLLEESSSTQSAYEPKAIVYMRALEQSDYPVALVAIHEGDPMHDSAYSDFLFNFRQHYAPYYFFDRRLDANLEELSVTFHRLRKYFGFADINLQLGQVWPGKLDLNVEVKPAIKLEGSYRLTLILTEDDVHGSDTGWAQRNRYKNNNLGPMGGFESLPDPVPSALMYYDWVGRSIAPEGNGSACLPNIMEAAGSYRCALRTSLRPGWNRDKLTAIVALIRLSDSTVLNTARLRLGSLSVSGASGAGPQFSLYPNPSNGGATLRFESASEEAALVSLTDISGRLLYSAATGRGGGVRELFISTAALPSGMYLVSLQQGYSRTTQKLQVLH